MGSYQKRTDFVTRQIGAETILVPIKKAVIHLGSIYTMNKVAARIWNLLDHPLTAGEIVQTITKEFRVTPEQAAHDVQDFLHRLKEDGLLEEMEQTVTSV